MEKAQSILSLRNVSLKFDSGHLAVKDVTFDIHEHEFISIVGPSGCGKSTILKMISGLQSPTSGEVLKKGQIVKDIDLDVGFITQDSNLFPWLTLKKNVEFPLKMRGVPAEERNKRVKEWIEIAGLKGFEDSYPYQLSGGMQKRGSIIRTLVYQPDIILMDEPFGSLDAQTRMLLQSELLEMWKRDKSTILFVTHDLQEAVSLSDRVILFSKSPGTNIKILDIPIERPRNVFEITQHHGYQEIYHELWQSLQMQFNEQRVGLT